MEGKEEVVLTETAHGACTLVLFRTPGGTAPSLGRPAGPGSSARAGRQPALDVRPGVLLGPGAGHDADVAALDAEQLLVAAADPAHDALGLAGRGDVVGLGDHVEHAGLHPAEVHALAAEGE